MADDLYRQYIPDLNLAIEKGSESVPNDGKYHVLRDGKILESFRFLKQAQELFKAIVKESGYKPQPSKTARKSASQQNIDSYLEAKEFYWADSYKYRGGGGRGGRGGV